MEKSLSFKLNFMNKSIVARLEFYFPVLIAVLYFFVQIDALNSAVFIIPSLLLGFYFFPLRPLLKMETLKAGTLTSKIIFIFANIIFSIILVLTVIKHFYNEPGFFGNLLAVVSILNVLLAIYFYFFNSNRKFLLLHLGFVILTSALSAV